MNAFIKYGILCWLIFAGNVGWAQTPEETSNADIAQWQSLLEDLTTDEQVWREAAKRLVDIDNDEANQAVLTATAHIQDILQETTTTKEDWRESVKRLVMLDTEASRDALQRFFAGNPERAKVTYETLWALDAQTGWANHLALIQTESIRSDVRKMAIIGLGEHKVDEARGPLFNLTQNEQEDIRCAAIKSLGDLGDNRAVPLLMNMIRNKECDVGDRASAAGYISMLSGEQTEAYLSELSGSDEERVSKAAKWALADYRNQALQGQAAVGTAFNIEEQGNGSVLIAEEQPSASVGYVIEISRNGELLHKAFTPSGSVTELHLPTGDYICSILCLVPERLYSPYWEGGAAGLCDASQEIALTVQQADVEQITFQGTAASVDLTSLLQEPERFVDQPLLLTGTLGKIPGVKPLWGLSTRQDWPLSQNGQTVIITNSSVHKYFGKAGKQITVLGELKRSMLKGGYRLVSIADWLVEWQEE